MSEVFLISAFIRKSKRMRKRYTGSPRDTAAEVWMREAIYSTMSYYVIHDDNTRLGYMSIGIERIV